MTQESLSKKVGCSKETIRKIEKDKLILSKPLAERIFLSTGISVDWLLNNDFSALPVEGWTKRPYTKEIYERVRSKIAPQGAETFQDRVYLGMSFEKLLWAFLAAEKKSAQVAALVGYRFHSFVEELNREFGQEKFSWSQEGMKPWDRVQKAIRVYLHEANPLPVLFDDGTEAVVHPEERITPDELKRRVRAGTRRKKVKTS